VQGSLFNILKLNLDLYLFANILIKRFSQINDVDSRPRDENLLDWLLGSLTLDLAEKISIFSNLHCEYLFLA